MIVKLPGAAFLVLSMIVAFPVVSLGLLHFLGPLSDCDILSDLSMIVALPVTS